MKMKFKQFFLVLTILPLLVGCWNQKELNDLALVMGVGVDKGKTKKYKSVYQIVIPSNVSAGQSGGGQGLPIAVYTSEGNTLTQAARKVTQNTPRILYYGHTNLSVLGEDVAKGGVFDIFDVLERYPEFRTTTQIVMTKGVSAEDLLTTLTTLDKLPVQKITKTLKVTQSMLGEDIRVSVDDFVSALVSEGKVPFLTVFTLVGNLSDRDSLKNVNTAEPQTVIKADGIGVFRDGKLTGYISNKDARGVAWILNKIKNSEVNFNWKGKKDAIAVLVNRSKTAVSARVKNGKPTVHVVIKEEGVIGEVNTALDVNNPEVIASLEKKTAEEIKKQVLSSINAAKDLHSDVFGFGESVHREDPKLWHHIKRNWLDDYFPDLDVTVDVKSYIRREGVRTLPFWSDLPKHH